uniref:Proliferating cell nuclear antigen PCNA N-terminal domain-containing protein n=1 Tax=Cannabis sativa TaxID=3483 RepID=A0A803P1U0_CANSA
MLELRLVQGLLLKKLVVVLKDLVTDANFDCLAIGFSLKGMGFEPCGLGPCLTVAEDSWYWSMNIHGQYQVKKAYKFLHKDDAFLSNNDEQHSSAFGLREEAAMVAWAVWNARNSVVWQEKSSSTVDVILSARVVLNQWLYAHSNKGGSLFVPSGSDGWAESAFVEALGIKKALSWIDSKGWGSVQLGTDSLVSVQAVFSSLNLPSPFGLVIQDCSNDFGYNSGPKEHGDIHDLQATGIADVVPPLLVLPCLQNLQKT